jgi:hypothetical protein
MFRHRQQLRRWAARVLFLWLFGLAVGVANACLATSQTAPAGTGVAHLADSAAVSLAGPSHQHKPLNQAVTLPAHGDDVQVHEGSLAKANCQDFCNKTTTTIPSVKSALDDLQSHAVLVTASVAVLPAPAFAPVQMWVPRRDGVRSPPIPIVFLRLTL